MCSISARTASARSVPGRSSFAARRSSLIGLAPVLRTSILLALGGLLLLAALDARAQQGGQTGAGRYVPAPKVEAAAEAAYRTDCPFTETRFEPSPLGRPAQIFAPAHCAPAGAPFRARRYGVSPDGLPFTRSTSEVGHQADTFTDGGGRTVCSVSAPDGIAARTAFTYDALGRLTKVVGPEGETRTYRYSARGLLRAKATPEADGNSDGDPTDEDATAGAADTRYQYDRGGALRFRQDAAERASGTVFFQQYDGLGRPTESGVAPLPAGTAFTGLDGLREERYDFETDTAYWRSVRAYDAAPDPGAFPWSRYDWAGVGTLENVKGRLAATARRVAAGRTRWRLTFRSYGPQGHLRREWVFSPGTPRLELSYERDRQGRLVYRRAELAGSAGERSDRSFCWWYAYTARGLVKAVYARKGCASGSEGRRPATAEVSFTYTAAGSVESTVYKQDTYEGSLAVPRTYGARGGLTQIDSLDFGGSRSPFGARYRYRADGSVRQARFLQEGRPAGASPKYRYDYRYDALGRLRAADYSYYTRDGLQQTEAYDVSGPPDSSGGGISYDRSGNLLRLSRRGEGGGPVDRLALRYAKDEWAEPSGRLAGVRDAAGARHGWDAGGGAFGYDRAGRLASAPAPYGITAAHYDERGLPTEHVLSATGDTIRYRYSLAGRRTYRRVGAGIPTRSVLGEGSAVLAMLAGRAVEHWKLVLPSGRGVGHVEAAGERRYYLTDRLGSVRAVIDGEGQVVEAKDYYPFGLRMPGRSVVREGPPAAEDFTGHERDRAAGGLLYAGARYLMPAFGRWTTTDPLLDGSPAGLVENGKLRYLSATPYNYVFNNPTGLIDPTGLSAHCPTCDPVTQVYQQAKAMWNSVVNAVAPLNPFSSGAGAQATSDAPVVSIEVGEPRVIEVIGSAPMVPLSNTGVTSEFTREDRVLTTNNGGQGRPHEGIDLRADIGTPVLSSDDGNVSAVGGSAQSSSGYGLNVIIDHAGGIQARYGHLSSTRVNDGQAISRGDTIGLSGMSGNVTGPHLHFEVRDSMGRVFPPSTFVPGLDTLPRY